MDFNDEQWLRDNGLLDIADLSQLYEEIVSRRARGDDGIQAPVSKLHGLFSLPRRGFTILGAYSGTGKSSFASQWAVAAASNGHRVAVMSLEMPADFTLELMAEQAACLPEPHLPYVEKFAAWADQKIYLHSSTDVVSPEAVFRFVEVSATLLGCDLIIIDPLMRRSLCRQMSMRRKASSNKAGQHGPRPRRGLNDRPSRPEATERTDRERQRPDKAAFLGSTHLTGAAAAVCTLWADPVRREARTNGLEVDDKDSSTTCSPSTSSASHHGTAQHSCGLTLGRGLYVIQRLGGISRSIRIDECRSESNIIGEFPSAGSRRYFSDEQDARDFQRDRARDDDELRGIPFLDQVSEQEVISRLNELESSKALGQEFCS